MSSESASPGNRWKGRSVLVTGAGGFIGSHLTQRLVEEGADVTAYLRYNSEAAIGSLRHCPAEVLKHTRIAWGDIRDADSVRRAVKGQECVFHLAALIAIPYSYDAPRQYVETNVTGTLNVLEAVRANETPRMVQTSTSEVYGTPQKVPIDEGQPLQGQSPYSASKIGADKMAESYHRSFGVPVATLRPFNTYGPRQSPRAILPTIIFQAMHGDQLTLGRLDPIRDMNFVGDTVSGFLAIAASDAAIGKVVNIGTGHGVSVGEMVEAVGAQMKRKLTVVADPNRVRPADSEVERLIADASLAERLMGWKSTTSFAAGLEKTVAWFADQMPARDPGAYVV